MKFISKQFALCAFLLFSGLAFLPGCGWFKKSDSSSSSGSLSGDVLMTIDGKPVLTVQDYEDQLNMAREANPQIDMFLQMMPNAEKEFVFRGMATARLMKAWAQKEGVDQTEDFKKQQKHLHDSVDLQLYMKHFDDTHPIDISDNEVKAFYEEKKDSIPGLAITQGGTEIMYVRFDSKDKANAFFDKVKDVRKADAFKKIAEDGKHIAGQSVINEKSPFGENIKSMVLDIKKFPSVQVVKVGDDAYWVMLATGKVEPKYHDLKSPQVQQGLKKMIAEERKEKQMEELIEKLKSELNVVENNKYFEDKEAAKRAMAQSAGAENNDSDNDQQSSEPVKV